MAKDMAKNSHCSGHTNSFRVLWEMNNRRQICLDKGNKSRPTCVLPAIVSYKSY